MNSILIYMKYYFNTKLTIYFKVKNNEIIG